MGSQNGNLPSCTAGNRQKELYGNVQTPDMDMTSAVVEGSKEFFGFESGNGNLLKELISVEKVCKGTLELRRGMEQGFVEAKGGHIQGSNLFLTMKQAALKSERKRLGKRAGVQFERERMQQKKPRPNITKVSTIKKENDGSRSPAAKVLKKLVSSPLQKKKESSVDHGVGILAKQEMKPAAPTALFRVQPKFRVQDITKEEAALEYKQCVSLLWKYGVLNSREFYLSQNFPHCAPHPGSVGDKLQSNRCKICRAPEDANSTVFCDECQEAFHLSCCLPRLYLKHFDKEDDWYCGSCRKQKRRMGSFNSSRFFESGYLDSHGKVYSAELNYTSKVRLGLAHQAEVPVWTGKVDDSSSTGHFGMDEPLSQDFKDEEKSHILKDYELRVQTLKGQSANMLSDGTSENWLKCNNVLVQAFRDNEGHEHSEIICGKWRRAPLNVQQWDQWECFCVMEWDPLRADCAVAQELPTEEILQRIQVKSDLQPSEVLKMQEA